MPRRAEVQARPIEPDAVYGSPLVTQVINKVMLDGKKSIAEQIVYDALETVATKAGRPPVEVLEQAVKTVTPVLEVRSRRVGGANYQVPIEVPQRRARLLRLDRGCILPQIDHDDLVADAVHLHERVVGKCAHKTIVS